MALQIRRGTDAERLAITPLAGELIFTTDTKKLYVGDGTTAGGNQVDTTLSSQYLSVPSNITPDVSNTRDIGTNSLNWRTGYFQTVDAGHIDAGTINGDIVRGDSTVIVNAGTGVVTASLVGNVTGNVQGNLTGNSTGTHKGTVNADDNSIRIDGASDRITNGVLDFDGAVITLQSGATIDIGTSSSANGVGLRIFSTDHATRSALEIYADDSNNSTANSIETYTSRGSIVTPTVVAANDNLFNHTYYGHDGSAYVLSSVISATVDSTATVGSGSVPGYLLFATTQDNGSTLNFMVLNQDGNVGINNDAPTEKLDVIGNAKVSGSILLGRLDNTAIGNLTPENGMIVYNTSTNKFQGYENGAWANLI